METKTIYREYFPGYMGHIPMKNEVIGMTVGATNDYIKSYLTREPEFEQKMFPSTQNDYSYYNKAYFNENLSKEYKLEEDKIFSNHSKEAKTWISGSKYQIYPQHIPGYTAHIPGIVSSNLIGMNFAKTSAVAIKGDYHKNSDIPSDDRYTTQFKKEFALPKVKSEEEDDFLKKTFEQRNKNLLNSSNSFKEDKTSQLEGTFHGYLDYEAKSKADLPYIVGYKGFRRGIKSGNYYGKNFKEASLTSLNKALTNK